MAKSLFGKSRKSDFRSLCRPAVIPLAQAQPLIDGTLWTVGPGERDGTGYFQTGSKFIGISTILTLAVIVWSGAASAQEFTPPGGKGPAVVAVSGAMGADAYRPAAQRIAAMGYDVFLVDSRPMVGDQGAGLKAAVDQAQASPNASPGKIGVIGFSLGGGQVLGRASGWGDKVGAVVVFYPLNNVFRDVPAMIARIDTPVLILAGEADHFHDNCCTAGADRAITSAAQGAGKSVELMIYPGADHDFVVEANRNYDAKAAADAWTRAAAFLKSHLSG